MHSDAVVDSDAVAVMTTWNVLTLEKIGNLAAKAAPLAQWMTVSTRAVSLMETGEFLPLCETKAADCPPLEIAEFLPQCEMTAFDYLPLADWLWS